MLRSLLLIVCLMFVSPIIWGQESSTYSGDQAGFEQMIQDLLAASFEEREAITKTLIPTESEYYQVFSDEKYARKVFRYHKRLARQVDIVIRPLLRDQTEYVYWATNAAELAAYEGNARQFPGGYRELATLLNTEYTYYRFKFIQPGRKLGSAYDMLVYVNGHWRIFHRPWAVLKR